MALDAFDECDDDQQEEVLILIDAFLAYTPAKIILTSRPHLKRLRAFPHNAVQMHVSAEDADVRTYISWRLKKVRNLSQDMKTKILEKLSDAAKGM